MWQRLFHAWLAISLLGLSLAGPAVGVQLLTVEHEDESVLAGLSVTDEHMIEDHDCTHLCHVSAHILGLGATLPRLSRHLLAVDVHVEPLAWLVHREDQPPTPPPCRIA